MACSPDQTAVVLTTGAFAGKQEAPQETLRTTNFPAHHIKACFHASSARPTWPLGTEQSFASCHALCSCLPRCTWTACCERHSRKLHKVQWEFSPGLCRLARCSHAIMCP